MGVIRAGIERYAIVMYNDIILILLLFLLLRTV